MADKEGGKPRVSAAELAKQRERAASFALPPLRAGENDPGILDGWEGPYRADVPPQSWILARATRLNGHAPVLASTDASPLASTAAPLLPPPSFERPATTAAEAATENGTLSSVQINAGLWAAYRISMLRRDSRPNSVEGPGERGESALLEALNTAVGERLGITDRSDWTTREIIAFVGYATGRLTDIDAAHNLTQQEAQVLLGQARELFAATEGQPALQADLTRVLLIRPGQALPDFWTRIPGRMEQQVTQATAHSERVIAALPTLSEQDGVTTGTFHDDASAEPARNIPERVEDVADLTPNVLRAPFLFGETRDRALELVSQAQAFLALDEVPGIETAQLRADQEALARQLITPEGLAEAGNDQMAIINAAREDIDLTDEDVDVSDALIRGAATAISTQLAFLAGHRAVEYHLEDPAETDSLADNYTYQGEKLAVLARMGEVLLSESSPLQGEARQAFRDDMAFLATQLGTSPELLLTSLRLQGPCDEATTAHLSLLTAYQYPSYFIERGLPEVAERSAQALIENVVAKSNEMRDLLLSLYPSQRQQLAELVGIAPQALLFGGDVYNDIAIAPEAIRPTEQLVAWALRIHPDLILTTDTDRGSLSPLDSSLYPIHRAFGMAIQIVEALEQDLQTQEIEVGISGTEHTHTLTRAEAMQAIGGLLSIFELQGQRDDFGPQIRSALAHLEEQLPLHELGPEKGTPSAADIVIQQLTLAYQARQAELAGEYDDSDEEAQPDVTPTSHPDAFRTGSAIELLRFGEQHADAFMEHFGVSTPMEARMQLASLILQIDRDESLSRKGQVIGPQLITLLIRLSNMREDMRREIEEASDWEGHPEIEADPTLTEQDQRYATVFEDESLVLEASATRRDDLAARISDLPYDHDFEWPAEHQPQSVTLVGVDVMDDPDAGTQHHVAQFSDGRHVVLDTVRSVSGASVLPTYDYPLPASGNGDLGGLPGVFDSETGQAAPFTFSADGALVYTQPSAVAEAVERHEEPSVALAAEPVLTASVPVLSAPTAVSSATSSLTTGRYLPSSGATRADGTDHTRVERPASEVQLDYTVVGNTEGREVRCYERVVGAPGEERTVRHFELALPRLSGPRSERQKRLDAQMLAAFLAEHKELTK